MSERHRNPDRDRYRPGDPQTYWRTPGFGSSRFGAALPEESFHPTARVGYGARYIGDGNYSSGEYEADAPPDYDYDYAGFKGESELSSVTDWRDAPDIADPTRFQIYHTDEHGNRSKRRGPRGYRRSDERILEDIYEHLMSTHHLDTSDVRIEVQQDGTAILTGTVPERPIKHALEDLIHHIRDVRDVDNRIRVDRNWSER